jgi:uncharacterized metal-binding protein
LSPHEATYSVLSKHRGIMGNFAVGTIIRKDDLRLVRFAAPGG